MEAARLYLARATTPMQAFMGLQHALMAHFIARGGTPEDFVARLAPRFRSRYGWILTQITP